MSRGLSSTNDSPRAGRASLLGGERSLSARLFPIEDGLEILEQTLREARMTDPVDRYLARAARIGLVVGLVLASIGAGVGYALFESDIDPIGGALAFAGRTGLDPLLALLEAHALAVIVGGTAALFGVVGATLGFVVAISRPYVRAAGRRREIDALLPDVISFMYAQSVGGLDELEILEAVAEADDAYGELAVEFETIRREIEYFGVDHRSAIRTRARETPSDELEQFLLDFLSTIDSGGDVERFLEEKVDRHERAEKQRQERTLDTLELVGELYMTLSLFPLLVLIVVVVMQLVPDATVPNQVLYAAVYGLVPAIGVGFLVLVSTVTFDEPGDGRLEAPGDGRLDAPGDRRFDAPGDDQHNCSFLSQSFSSARFGETGIFAHIATRERAYQLRQRLTRPHVFFREYPLATLGLTVPVSIAVVLAAAATGIGPRSWAELTDAPLVGTAVYLYVPLYLVSVPLAVFHEWNVYRRQAITGALSETLRALSSANDTGQTVLESLESVSRTAGGALAAELAVVRTRVEYGTNLDAALVAFNNDYRIPRVARTTRLVAEAQKTTNHITPVLQTAAATSETHDELERERRSRTRVQVVIIVMTFLTVFAVIAVLQTQFVQGVPSLESGSGAALAGDEGSGHLAGGDPANSLDADLLSTVFFHAVTLQAIGSGLVCGSLRNASPLSGLKYVVALSTVALVGWAVVI